MEITREKIIETVGSALKDNPSVFALWLEGADATNTLDEHSDIDFWIDVKDGEEESVFEKIKEFLLGLGELNFHYTMRHPDPHIKQKVFHLKNTPDSLLIDVCIQNRSRNFEFTKGVDEEIKVIFDKGVIKWKELNQEEFEKEVQERIRHIKQAFAQKVRVLTKVRRGDFLEALMYYNKWIVAPLVELLRIKHIPRKRDYHFKHISRDLPKEINEQLEALCKVKSLEDIEKGIAEAEKLFTKTLKELN